LKVASEETNSLRKEQRVRHRYVYTTSRPHDSQCGNERHLGPRQVLEHVTEDDRVKRAGAKRKPNIEIRNMAVESLLTTRSGFGERKRHTNWIVPSGGQESEIATSPTADIKHSAFGWIDKSHQLRQSMIVIVTISIHVEGLAGHTHRPAGTIPRRSRMAVARCEYV
jgi:hypothetical protein